LMGIERTSGAVRWTRQAASANVAVTLAAGVAYVVTDDGLQAAETTTGRERWHTDEPFIADGGPAISGGHLFAGTTANDVVAIGPRPPAPHRLQPIRARGSRRTATHFNGREIHAQDSVGCRRVGLPCAVLGCRSRGESAGPRHVRPGQRDVSRRPGLQRVRR